MIVMPVAIKSTISCPHAFGSWRHSFHSRHARRRAIRPRTAQFSLAVAMFIRLEQAVSDRAGGCQRNRSRVRRRRREAHIFEGETRLERCRFISFLGNESPVRAVYGPWEAARRHQVDEPSWGNSIVGKQYCGFREGLDCRGEKKVRRQFHRMDVVLTAQTSRGGSHRLASSAPRCASSIGRKVRAASKACSRRSRLSIPVITTDVRRLRAHEAFDGRRGAGLQDHTVCQTFHPQHTGIPLHELGKHQPFEASIMRRP